MKEVKEKKTKKKVRFKHKPAKITVFVFLLDLLCAYTLSVIYLNPTFKAFWIPTAMTTMHHQYLAYTLYDEDEINKVMSENYIVETAEQTDFDAIVLGDTSEKDHYSSIYEEQIFTRDPGNDIYKIIRIEESKFKGYLTVIYDPKNVELAVPEKLGKYGQSVAKMCQNNNGLVGINGGGFEDLDGWGNGSTPYGAIIKDGELIYQHAGGDGGLIGFTKDHKMYLTHEDPQTAIQNGMMDAVEFGPFLIVNGKVSQIYGDGGWGRADRTVIAQRKDGIVLFLIIEGRQPGYSLGATMSDVQKLLLRYKAYNAANLDGGASSTMAVNGKLFNRPSAGGEYGGRTVSNAWIVVNNQTQENVTP